MSCHYAFNGDADGLCALQQLRLADPRSAVLVTGVKRDIALLERVHVRAGDEVTALDISLDRNREAVHALLNAGASVRYFDHHHAGELPVHRGFEAHIDEAPDVCTSLLVDRYLGGRYRPWAVVAAFGDGLRDVAIALARGLGMDPTTIAAIERLGIVLNYNAYGEHVRDLHFHPVDLAHEMLPFDDPREFMRASPSYAKLVAGYDEDMRRARELEPLRQTASTATLLLPAEPWARRALGVLANEWKDAHPDRSIAILSPKAHGGYTVSVRVPAHRPVTADALCRRFPTGGGRRLAGGINHLAEDDVERFHRVFESDDGAAEGMT